MNTDLEEIKYHNPLENKIFFSEKNKSDQTV